MRILIVGSHDECDEALEAIALVLDLGTVSEPRPARGGHLGDVEVYARAEIKEYLNVVPPPANPIRFMSARSRPAAAIELGDRILVHGRGWVEVVRLWPTDAEGGEAVWIWTAPDRPLDTSVFRADEQVRVCKRVADAPVDGAR